MFYEFMNNPIVKNEYKKYNIDDNVYHETNQKIRCLYSPKPAYKTYPKTKGLYMLNETDDIKNHIIQITEEEVTQLQTLNIIIPTQNKNPITSYCDNNDDEYIPYQTSLDNVILKNIQHPFFNMIANSSCNEWEKTYVHVS